MLTLKQIKQVNTYEDLEGLGIGRVYCDISDRGGGIGFYAKDIADYFNVNDYDLPSKFGAGCNYLGGGIRGSIFASTFSKRIWENSKKTGIILEALAEACVRVYENLENESQLNDEEIDGETNWEALGTKQSRKNGVISAY